MPFIIGALAFISEYLDSGLGMGYGTALAPILILLGFAPLKVIPAILISQLITDIAACISHHNASNVNFHFNSRDFRIASGMGLISCIGAIASVAVAVKIPKFWLTLYIGILVLTMGTLVLATAKRALNFSWKKITCIACLASFNKGISGGGYGPLVMGGQILSGVYPKNAVGVTAFAEALTCLVGFISYLVLGKSIDWKLTLLLVLCATPAVPLAALSVKKINSAALRNIAGILMVILGTLTILKISGS